MTDPLRVVFIDNVDSFTWNLVDEFAKRGAAVEVWRNTVTAELAMARALTAPRALIVVSPGPGAPSEAGCSVDLIRAAEGKVPVYGVCLGHQAIVQALGGTVGPADAVVHGKTSKITHRGGALFAGVTSPFAAGRYHSLTATRLPPCLESIASVGSLVMAVRHRTAPMLGVQFHPESILTPEGGRMVENVLAWARGWRDRDRA